LLNRDVSASAARERLFSLRYPLSMDDHTFTTALAQFWREMDQPTRDLYRSGLAAIAQAAAPQLLRIVAPYEASDDRAAEAPR
jgi:gamma-glutamylcysteine synthetase